ncbi:MAG: PHP domain-containing protein, partial [Planctomycetota bacterium]
MRYVELHAKSNFSFLCGASHPDELVARAAELGYAGLALTDSETLAGVVRGYGAAKDLEASDGSSSDFRYLVGAEVHPVDAPSMVLWPTDRASYGRLCQLLSRGRLRREKGSCEIHWADVCEFADGMVAGALPAKPTSVGLESADDDRQVTARFLGGDFRDVFSDAAHLLCSLHRGVDDQTLISRCIDLSARSGVPLVASGDVHYHTADRMLMHDCVTAIRNGATIDQIHEQRFANSQYHLRSLEELRALYREIPRALERTVEIAQRCDFSLAQLRYEYPEEIAPNGMTPIEHLKRLTWEGACQRWPGGVPKRVIDLLKHEIELIEDLRYEAYFLTVWDMVRFARSRGILCQGRGSAANSTVCYCLGITSVDPNRADLLFERFISRERNEAPDIDVDFEHQRREEVLQYLYEKYGRDRAGMTATVTTYRSKSAIREVGKALGLSADLIDSLSKIAGSHFSSEAVPEGMVDCGLDPASEIGQRFS